MSQKVIPAGAHWNAHYDEWLTSLSEARGDRSTNGRRSAPDPSGRDRLRLLRLQGGGRAKAAFRGARRITEAERASMDALQEHDQAQRSKFERHWIQTKEAREACDSVLDRFGGR